MKRFLLLLTLAVMVPASAFAVAGDLSTLTFGFPDGTPLETQKKMHNFLTHDLSLVKGKFMNTFITQSFSGSTSKLNELVQLLQTCKFELEVRFSDLKDDGVTFLLFQNMAGTGKAMITINTTKTGFKWSELKFQIPPGKEVKVLIPQ